MGSSIPTVVIELLTFREMSTKVTPQPHPTPDRAPGAPLCAGRTLTGDFEGVSQLLPYEGKVHNGEIVNQQVGVVTKPWYMQSFKKGTPGYWSTLSFPKDNDDNDDGSTTEPYPEPGQPTRWSTRIRKEPDWFKPVAFTRRSNRKKPAWCDIRGKITKEKKKSNKANAKRR